MKKYLTHILWAVAVVAALAGGITYGKNSAAANAAGGQRGTATGFTRGVNGVRGGGGFAAGSVTAKDAQSITLQLPNGNSEVVFYSPSTSIIKPSPASINDVAVGTNVTVGGTQNSDGSVTADTIQIRVGTTTMPGAPRTP